MNNYVVIAHEAFKEEGVYFYEGSWNIEKLKQFTIEQIIENSDTEYDNDEEAEELQGYMKKFIKDVDKEYADGADFPKVNP